MHGGELPPPWLAPGFVVNLVVAGEADLTSRGAAHRVGPGDVVLANPGQLRAVTRRHTATARTQSFTVDPSHLREAVRARHPSARDLSFESATSRSVELRLSLEQLYARISRAEPRLAIDSAVETVLDFVGASLTRADRMPSPRHPRVDRAREYLDAHFDLDVGLDELVVVSGLSRAHLIREFRRIVGIPPHQYLIHSRVRKARALLACGASVAETAAAAGFFDQSHFSRHFRRLVGVPATDYRRSMRQERLVDDPPSEAALSYKRVDRGLA